MSGTGGQGLEGAQAVLEDLLLSSESMNPLFGLAYLQAFASNPSPWGRLAEIVAPALILRGQLDTMMSPRHVVALRAAIPGAEFTELASTGHFPYLTHRDMFNRALSSFLTRAEKNAPLSN